MSYRTVEIIVALGLAALFVFSVCRTPDDDGPLVTYKGGASGDDAAGGGILTLRGECLGTTSAGSAELRLFALPKSAKWIESEQAIEYKGTKVRVGEVFVIGGGVASQSFDNWSSAPDSSCSGGRVFLGGSLTSCVTPTAANRNVCNVITHLAGVD